jgi:hypothetical protein
MPDKLGPKVPANRVRAARNRETVRRLALKHDPLLVMVAGQVLGDASRAAVAAVRVRRGSGTRRTA